MALRNEPLVLHRRIIDFKEVYGDSFEDSQRDLFKYFVKSFAAASLAPDSLFHQI